MESHPTPLKTYKNQHGTMKNQSGTIKTNPELYRVVMGGSGGYMRLPGGSVDFSWQTDTSPLYIYHHSAREVATCDREPGTGSLRLGPLKCPGGLYFDIERQTWENLRWRKSSETFDFSLTCRCDWLANVNNCDVLSLPRRVKPNLQVVSNMLEKRRKKYPRSKIKKCL